MSNIFSYTAAEKRIFKELFTHHNAAISRYSVERIYGDFRDGIYCTMKSLTLSSVYSLSFVQRNLEYVMEFGGQTDVLLLY